MDFAGKQTDIEMAELEKELAEVYRSASDELQKTANEYFSSFAERYEKEHNAYLQGKYTDQEFKSWYYSQVGRGERWQTLKTDAAQRMVSVNQQVADYINSKAPGIYTLNSNFAAYEIEKASGVAFNLVNEDVVRELALNKNHSEFRVLSVNPKRDYQWNQQRIQNELLSGILQGKSIDRLAEGFMNVMGSNEKAAIRNARTAMTSAQNAGRQNAYERAEEMGIEMEKEWVATNDGRTRDSHRELDGVRVNVDDEFPNGLLYPGDPKGEPEEAYNCRCTMITNIKKYKNANRTTNTSASYKEWVKSKEVESTKGNGDGIIKLPDITIPKSVGAKFRDYDVEDKMTGKIYHFVEGTKIQNAEVFAGYGTSQPLKDEVREGLTSQYKSKTDNWQHSKGIGVLNVDGEEIKAEVHWFQEESVGKQGFKIKKWIFE